MNISKKTITALLVLSVLAGTLVAVSANGDNVLWDNGLPIDFDAYSCVLWQDLGWDREVVDDFDVPEPGWDVTDGHFRIITFSGFGPGNISGVSVFFYADNGTEPSTVRYAERVATYNAHLTGKSNYTFLPGNPEIAVDCNFDTVTLAPGKWWVCFQPEMDDNSMWLTAVGSGETVWVSHPALYPKWTNGSTVGYYGDVSFQLTGVSALKCDCDLCVNETGWWRNNETFNANLSTPIQAAVDNASAGDTICVQNGTYQENVDVNKSVTIKSQYGAAYTTVQAANVSDHVFHVTANYVNISGFTVKNATETFKAGIYLGSGVEHCTISNNTVSNNYRGVYLWYSSNNNLTGNNASNNTAGIFLYNSDNNNLTGNNASNNSIGINLRASIDNNLTKNTASNNNDGIYLDGSYDNHLAGNTASNNSDVGLTLYQSYDNILTVNTASKNSEGIWLRSSTDNNISCNWIHHNSQYGFYLSRGSYNNTIESNNIMFNGVLNNESGGYEYNFYNNQSNNVTAIGDYWGTSTETLINASIYDHYDNLEKGIVDFSGYIPEPAECAPIPEAATILLFSNGLLALAGYAWLVKKRK